MESKLFIIFLFNLASISYAVESSTNSETLKKATFAGGCFWCIEQTFEGTEGVIEAISGYTGGNVANPSYERVCSGNTGHYEAVQVTFDSLKISYRELLYIFWKHIDPTDPGGQFADRGSQYKTAIFYRNNSQKELALHSKEKLQEMGIFEDSIVTEIKKLDKFYPAEDYHQDFYKNCPLRYKRYKMFSGRQEFLEKIWGDEDSPED